MKVKNLQTVTNALQKYGKDIEKGVQDILQRNTENLASDAYANKPNNTIEPINIDWQVENNIGYVWAFSNTAGSDIPIYYEVGTGLSYKELEPRLTKEQRAIALTAYKNGKGRIIAHPYLFPAFFINSKKFIQDIKRLVKQKTKG